MTDLTYPPPPPASRLARAQVGDLNRSGFPMVAPDTSNYAEPDPGIEVCDECGEKHSTREGHQSCQGHTGLGLPCRANPMRETATCRKHGSSLPVVAEARRRRLAAVKAAKTLADVNVTPIGNPIDHLSDLAAEAIALKDHFADVVAELRQIGSPLEVNDDGEIVARARDDHGYRFTDDKGSEQLDARVALYERAMDRAEKFLVNLVKIDFEEKRIRLDEARVGLMMEFVQQLIGGLGLALDDPKVEALIRGLAPILDGLPAIIEAEVLEEVEA